jgi:hypothetical protein
MVMNMNGLLTIPYSGTNRSMHEDIKRKFKTDIVNTEMEQTDRKL